MFKIFTAAKRNKELECECELLKKPINYTALLLGPMSAEEKKKVVEEMRAGSIASGVSLDEFARAMRLTALQ